MSAKAPPAPSAPVKPQWEYSVSKDEVLNVSKRTACIRSNEDVKQKPPYSDTRVELCVRMVKDKAEAAFLLLDDDGQMLCGVTDCAYTMRTDDDAPKDVGMGPAADGSSRVMFLDNPASAYLMIVGSHVLRVKVPIYENGFQNVTFDLGGLRSDPATWSPPKP